MEIKPLGSASSRRGPAESFTGTVWQNPIIEAPAPARIRCAWVRFEPRMPEAEREQRYGQWKKAVTKSLDWVDDDARTLMGTTKG